MRHLELSTLEIFRQVALAGSISAAAAKLNRVQSNISTRVKQLEERLGTALFERNRRGLSLTEEGHTLLRYADRLLSLSDEAVDALQAAKPSGSLRLGTMESTAASRLPPLLSRYHAQFPDVEIHLETDTAGRLTRRLMSNEIDVAFIAEPVVVEGLQAVSVFEEQLLLVAPVSFPALRRSDEISGRTMIAFEEGCAYRRYLNDWLIEEGIVPGNILSVGSYLAILACVSAGAGYAVVPRSVLDTIATQGEFRRHQLPKRYSRIKTLLVWRQNYTSPKLDALRALLPIIR
ncbi:MAG: LysR family transcriptional regulator [Hyphomicrobiaceae bacterium]